MVANEILCVDLLKGSLHLQLSLPVRQKSCCFSQLDVIWVLFWLWYCRLGSPAWGLYPTLLRPNHLSNEISLQHFSCHLWESSQLFCISSTLHTIHSVVLKWFLLSVCVYKVFLQLLFSWFFQMISLNLVVIPDWSWEEVSVASTYSFAILNPL